MLANETLTEAFNMLAFHTPVPLQKSMLWAATGPMRMTEHVEQIGPLPCPGDQPDDWQPEQSRSANVSVDVISYVVDLQTHEHESKCSFL